MNIIRSQEHFMKNHRRKHRTRQILPRLMRQINNVKRNQRPHGLLEPVEYVLRLFFQPTFRHQVGYRVYYTQVRLLLTYPMIQRRDDSFDRANARVPRNMYMKAACNHGVMLTLDTLREITGSVLLVAIAID